jgi:hypothetical protein
MLAISKRKNTTSTLKAAMDNQRLLLEQELDPQIAIFEFTHPDFYNQYHSLRNIDKTARGGIKQARHQTPTSKVEVVYYIGKGN